MKTFKKTIAEGIKHLRLSHNYSQEVVAEKIGISVQSLSNIERGVYFPKPETIDKICEAFNITPDVLCRPLDLPKSKSDLINNIDAILYSLDIDDLKQIYKIVETYSK